MKFRRNSQEFLETNSLNKFPEKSVNMVKFPENISGEILRNFVGKNSGEFLETESQNFDPTKISNLGDQF